MKYLLLIASMLAYINTSCSQTLGYQDLATLFSQNDHKGTARYESMGAAFGALGGDISSVNNNPAGLSFYNASSFTGSIQSRQSDITSVYYGNAITTQENYSNLSHAGAVIVFDDYASYEWSKFAVGLNYRITKDFSDGFVASGNSGVATFTSFPLDTGDTPINYNISDEQRFSNRYGGQMSEINVALSAVHQKKLYIGVGLNFYDIEFSQANTLTEFNSNENGDQLDANFYQQNNTIGTGFSLNTGFIYKVLPSFRVGVSYQTPTWFSEIIEETNIIENDGFFGDTEITVSNDNTIYDNTAGGYYPTQEFLYRLQTPSKLTTSAAFIFGKVGLISVDYTNRNFQTLRLSNSNNFLEENKFFETSMKRTNGLNIGTEWRLGRLSVRGGYIYEESPYTNALDSDHLKAYSYGGGYNFGNFKVDIAFSNNNRTGVYNFYPQYPEVDASALTLDNRMVTLTFTMGL